MNQQKKLLSIKNLTIHYHTNDGAVHAVDNLDLELGYGETLGFVGETGAGKTTTALGIMGIIPNPPGKVISGEIIFEDEDLLKKSSKDMRNVRGKKIAMIFQDPMTSLDPVITVGNQIAEMIKLHEYVTQKQAMEKAEEMLETVGIRKERAKDYPHQLSGGMKQRVGIAIALSCNPMLLIADEPYTVGLFNSIPDLDVDQYELNTIKGLVPDPTNIPKGCPFHPRCEKAMTICSEKKPEKIEVKPKHYVSCYLYKQNGRS